MNFNEAEQTLRAFFKNGWDGQAFAPPEIAWPDVEFTIPDNQLWVRFNCQENDGEQVSLGSPGNNRFRRYGIVTIQLFYPRGHGSIELRQYANLVKGMFVAQRAYLNDDYITFYDVYARQMGDDGHGFYQINIYAPFWYDEII